MRPVIRGSAAAKPRHSGYALRRTWQAFQGKRVALFTATSFALGSVFASTIGPWQLGKATDLLVDAVEQGQFDHGAFIVQLALVAAIYLIASGLNLAQAWLITDLVQSVGRKLREAAQAKLSRVPLSWYDAQPRGEVLSRFTNDIDNMVQSLQQVASQAMLSLLTIVGVLTIMLLLSPSLAAVSILSILISVSLTKFIAGRARPHFANQWRETGHLNATVEESFSGQTLIRVFGARERVEARFATQNEALVKASLTAQIFSAMIQPATMFVSNLAYISVITFGAFRVLAGPLSLGELQAFMQYIRQVGQPVSQLGNMAAQVQSALASAERVFELLDAPEMSLDDVRRQLPVPLQGHVVFEHVQFRYKPDQPLFENVSLEAKPGQTLAIVGPTGAGKTTLVNLLMRFYEIDKGTIRLDGIDIQELSRTELRSAMGMVLQDTWLFTGTVHDNIAYGCANASRDEVVTAAKRCQFDDFVRTLPNGYDTVLVNAGESLSQGQRQLLTIARAFMLDAPVLILDEATSSVDTRTEVLIQNALKELRVGRTSFVIAHRLSTIHDADLIIYMDAGNVREVGTHAELMAQRGGYWQLNGGKAIEHSAEEKTAFEV
ncbi:ABC transporter ATP-binding protein [Amphritea sp. 2_MG-2023]|uniref:ABC transporter ATP-binding protein n=1 Tax=Amphritea TaxID=515417 RepID=UPI001C064C6B|nr:MULTISPECIES: ABC transporter ATP-binding protein [Amphritea]MBU2964616.1 ABC transporter ATP-binding protein/permease [Amphritea atlantica]MDO6417945.1 ABC transporter ATP-binding protein [Amphritea sp. 2_MG-2023]